MSFAVQRGLSAQATAVSEAHGRRDRAAAPSRSDAAGEGAAPNSRHALLGALTEALESRLPGAGGASAADAQTSAGEHASTEALHAFVHALFAELRPSDAEGRHGRGFAWGRTTVAALGQRLDALIERLRGGTAAAAAPPVADSAAAPTADAPAVSATATAAESPVFTAFRELATARGAGGEEGRTADALMAVLRRVASALGGDAEALAPAAGIVLDVTA